MVNNLYIVLLILFFMKKKVVSLIIVVVVLLILLMGLINFSVDEVSEDKGVLANLASSLNIFNWVDFLIGQIYVDRTGSCESNEDCYQCEKCGCPDDYDLRPVIWQPGPNRAGRILYMFNVGLGCDFSFSPVISERFLNLPIGATDVEITMPNGGPVVVSGSVSERLERFEVIVVVSYVSVLSSGSDDRVSVSRTLVFTARIVPRKCEADSEQNGFFCGYGYDERGAYGEPYPYGRDIYNQLIYGQESIEFGQCSEGVCGEIRCIENEDCDMFDSLCIEYSCNQGNCCGELVAYGVEDIDFGSNDVMGCESPNFCDGYGACNIECPVDIESCAETIIGLIDDYNPDIVPRDITPSSCRLSNGECFNFPLITGEELRNLLGPTDEELDEIVRIEDAEAEMLRIKRDKEEWAEHVRRTQPSRSYCGGLFHSEDLHPFVRRNY